MKDWPVVIQDHHRAYISFDKYLGNQQRLRENAMMQRAHADESHTGAPREGHGLLQGLVRLRQLWPADVRQLRRRQRPAHAPVSLFATFRGAGP